ncbi:hypothetical protein E5Q_05603 [Mixia osmundae IAM 14324]|uniref:RING-type domain-containing protein n=2 Tax=Mixia osmundae (strain CBS 9802 / IAM 14324 / JCM 22182 / KY 12970) TaxID=764103 RepID=G7E7V5_MIXOS|nr:hypothetical protein E5Q_05603 [Mixia osmundae IAM 14324]
MSSNDTALTPQNSGDWMQIQWQSLGSLTSPVSLQLTADNSTGVARGALVHFSEQNDTLQTPSDAPWIAYINCDTNGTLGTYSMETDIITLCRDKGAVAVMLYSLTSVGCLVNEEYLDNFEKVLDVFATTDVQSSRLIESQFSNVLPSSFQYNATLLNASADAIWTTLNHSVLPVVPASDLSTTYPTSTSLDPNALSSTDVATSTSAPDLFGDDGTTTALAKRQITAEHSTRTSAADASRTASPGSTPSAAALGNYLIAILATANATVSNSTSSPAGTIQGGSSGSKASTSVAMIILYAISGLVTVLFLIVILSGAVRALRHPERYGPRSGHDPDHPDWEGVPQTRAGGITRAILDTFPVIKFGSRPSPTQPMRGEEAYSKSADDFDEADETGSKSEAVELAVMTELGHDDPVNAQEGGAYAAVSTADEKEAISPIESGQRRSMSKHAVDPRSVDSQQTCPICVGDFEDGDDLRILPCAGQHTYHRDCIDPWLLGVSSLCPLCRWDVTQSLQTDQAQDEVPSPILPAQSKFGRYLQQIRSNATRSGRARNARAAAQALS